MKKCGLYDPLPNGIPQKVEGLKPMNLIEVYAYDCMYTTIIILLYSSYGFLIVLFGQFLNLYLT